MELTFRKNGTNISFHPKGGFSVSMR